MKRLIGLMAWFGLASRLASAGYLWWWTFVAIQPRLPDEQNEHIANGIIVGIVLVSLVYLFDELTPGGSRAARKQADIDRKRERNIP